MGIAVVAVCQLGRWMGETDIVPPTPFPEILEQFVDNLVLPVPDLLQEM